MSQQLVEMKLSDLHINPNNPTTRTPDKELIASIKDIGIRTPLLVKKNDKGYVIIAGERRFKSAQELKLTTVPVIIQDDMSSEADATSLLLIDNLHRKNMNMYEEYQVIDALLKTMTIAEVAKKLNKSTTYIVRRTGLQNLIPQVIKGIQDNMPGLTERIVFIFARLPKDIQKSVWEASTEDYTVGGKASERFIRDEDGVEEYAKRESTEAFFSGEIKAEDAFRIAGDALGKVNLEKALDESLEEKTSLLPQTTMSDVQKKLIKEQLKVIAESDKLSTKDYSTDGLAKNMWRQTAKDDNPKTVKEGVIVDGVNAGKLVSYIKLNPNAKSNEKPKTEKQIEKERAERKERRFNNTVETTVVEEVFTMLRTEFNKTVITQGVADFLIKQLSAGWKNRTLRQLIGQEEYSKLSYDKAQDVLMKQIKSLSPDKQVLFIALAQAVPSSYDEVATMTGIDIKAIRKTASDALKAEMKKAEDAKIAEQARKESDRKAKAKQNKK